MNELYETNADFKAYVDKYMRKEEVDLETALSHAMVQNYADDIIKRIRAITEQVKALTDRLNRENEEMKVRKANDTHNRRY